MQSESETTQYVLTHVMTMLQALTQRVNEIDSSGINSNTPRQDIGRRRRSGIRLTFTGANSKSGRLPGTPGEDKERDSSESDEGDYPAVRASRGKGDLETSIKISPKVPIQDDEKVGSLTPRGLQKLKETRKAYQIRNNDTENTLQHFCRLEILKRIMIHHKAHSPTIADTISLATIYEFSAKAFEQLWAEAACPTNKKDFLMLLVDSPDKLRAKTSDWTLGVENYATEFFEPVVKFVDQLRKSYDMLMRGCQPALRDQLPPFPYGKKDRPGIAQYLVFSMNRGAYKFSDLLMARSKVDADIRNAENIEDFCAIILRENDKLYKASRTIEINKSIHVKPPTPQEIVDLLKTRDLRQRDATRDKSAVKRFAGISENVPDHEHDEDHVPFSQAAQKPDHMSGDVDDTLEFGHSSDEDERLQTHPLDYSMEDPEEPTHSIAELLMMGSTPQRPMRPGTKHPASNKKESSENPCYAHFNGACTAEFGKCRYSHDPLLMKSLAVQKLMAACNSKFLPEEEARKIVSEVYSSKKPSPPRPIGSHKVAILKNPDTIERGANIPSPDPETENDHW